MKSKNWKTPPVKPAEDLRTYRCVVRFDDEFDVIEEIQGRDKARAWVENVTAHGYWFGGDDNMTFYPANWVTLAEIEKIA